MHAFIKKLRNKNYGQNEEMWPMDHGRVQMVEGNAKVSFLNFPGNMGLM